MIATFPNEHRGRMYVEVRTFCLRQKIYAMLLVATTFQHDWLNKK